MYSDSGNMHLLTCMGEVSDQRAACRSFDDAPHVPVAATSAVSDFNEELQVDPLFFYSIIALRAMDVVSKHSLSIPATSKNLQEV